MQLKHLSDHVVMVIPDCGCRLTIVLGKDGLGHLSHHGICNQYPSCYPQMATAKGLAQEIFDSEMPEAVLLIEPKGVSE